MKFRAARDHCDDQLHALDFGRFHLLEAGRRHLAFPDKPIRVRNIYLGPTSIAGTSLLSDCLRARRREAVAGQKFAVVVVLAETVTGCGYVAKWIGFGVSVSSSTDGSSGSQVKAAVYVPAGRNAMV